MTYDPERHHRRSIRLPHFDYAGNATYFLTLCLEQREEILGQVVDGEMHLNTFGRIIEEEWWRSAAIRDELTLHTLVVMPNHIHGLLTMTPTHPTTNPPMPMTPALHRPARSLGSFVAAYKVATTKQVNALRATPGARVWQRGYHEHIVRAEQAFLAIFDYILANPANWRADRDNPSRTGDDPLDRWFDRPSPPRTLDDSRP